MDIQKMASCRLSKRPCLKRLKQSDREGHLKSSALYMYACTQACIYHRQKLIGTLTLNALNY